MRAADPIEHLWIIGPGRLGLAMGWELRRAGAATALSYLGRSQEAPSHPVFSEGDASYLHGEAIPATTPAVVLITLPDQAIQTEAVRLSKLGLPPGVAIHTSGVLGAEALSPLASVGWSTGSLHPLVAIPHPTDSAPKLRGAWYGIEGVEEAVLVAETIVAALHGRPLHVAAEQKPAYHAAAVLASNYVVALLAAALRVAARAGISVDEATAALTALAAGAVADVASAGAEAALTGPIVRGDVRTVELHLARLSPDERALYSVLGREAVAIACRNGLAEQPAAQIIRILETGNS